MNRSFILRSVINGLIDKLQDKDAPLQEPNPKITLTVPPITRPQLLSDIGESMVDQQREVFNLPDERK